MDEVWRHDLHTVTRSYVNSSPLPTRKSGGNKQNFTYGMVFDENKQGHWQLINRWLKSPQYTWRQKQYASDITALTYVDPQKDYCPKAFGADTEEKNHVGIIAYEDDVLINRIFSKDAHTCGRPFEVDTAQNESYKSEDFYSNRCNSLAELVSSGITTEHNEVLARVKKVSAIVIFQDTIKDRLIAQKRALELQKRRDELNTEFGQELYNPGKPVPIVFYTPKNAQRHLTEYTLQEQQQDFNNSNETELLASIRKAQNQSSYIQRHGVNHVHINAAQGNLANLENTSDKELSQLDNDGRSAVHYAAQNGQIKVLEHLHSRGFDIVSQDILQAAIDNGWRETAHWLVDQRLKTKQTLTDEIFDIAMEACPFEKRLARYNQLLNHHLTYSQQKLMKAFNNVARIPSFTSQTISQYLPKILQSCNQFLETTKALDDKQRENQLFNIIEYEVYDKIDSGTELTNILRKYPEKTDTILQYVYPRLHTILRQNELSSLLNTETIGPHHKHNIIDKIKHNVADIITTQNEFLKVLDALIEGFDGLSDPEKYQFRNIIVNQTNWNRGSKDLLSLIDKYLVNSDKNGCQQLLKSLRTVTIDPVWAYEDLKQLTAKFDNDHDKFIAIKVSIRSLDGFRGAINYIENHLPQYSRLDLLQQLPGLNIQDVFKNIQQVSAILGELDPEERKVLVNRLVDSKVTINAGDYLNFKHVIYSLHKDKLAEHFLSKINFNFKDEYDRKNIIETALTVLFYGDCHVFSLIVLNIAHSWQEIDQAISSQMDKGSIDDATLSDRLVNSFSIEDLAKLNGLSVEYLGALLFPRSPIENKSERLYKSLKKKAENNESLELEPAYFDSYVIGNLDQQHIHKLVNNVIIPHPGSFFGNARANHKNRNKHTVYYLLKRTEDENIKQQVVKDVILPNPDWFFGQPSTNQPSTNLSGVVRLLEKLDKDSSIQLIQGLPVGDYINQCENMSTIKSFLNNVPAEQTIPQFLDKALHYNKISNDHVNDYLKIRFNSAKLDNENAQEALLIKLLLQDQEQGLDKQSLDQLSRLGLRNLPLVNHLAAQNYSIESILPDDDKLLAHIDGDNQLDKHRNAIQSYMNRNNEAGFVGISNTINHLYYVFTQSPIDEYFRQTNHTNNDYTEATNCTNGDSRIDRLRQCFQQLTHQSSQSKHQQIINDCLKTLNSTINSKIESDQSNNNNFLSFFYRTKTSTDHYRVMARLQTPPAIGWFDLNQNKHKLSDNDQQLINLVDQLRDKAVQFYEQGHDRKFDKAKELYQNLTEVIANKQGYGTDTQPCELKTVKDKLKQAKDNELGEHANLIHNILQKFCKFFRGKWLRTSTERLADDILEKYPSPQDIQPK